MHRLHRWMRRAGFSLAAVRCNACPSLLTSRIPLTSQPNATCMLSHCLPARSLNVCYFHGAFETDAAVQLVLEHLTGGQLWER